MRTASVNLINHLDSEGTTLARLWRVTRADGTVLRFTDNDRPIVFDGDTYRSDVSFTSSAVFMSSKLASAQSVSITVAMADDAINEADLRAGKYLKALSELMIVNYQSPADGVIKLFSGRFGAIEYSDKLRATIEVLPRSAAEAGIGSEVYSPTCRASLGDARCTIDLDSLKVAFTVDAVDPDGLTIDATEFVSIDDDRFALGFVKWLTGDNTGITSAVVRSSSTGNLTVASVPNTIQVGDTGEAFPGCDKLIKTCRDEFDNVVNFRGEPHVPQDSIYEIPTVRLRT